MFNQGGYLERVATGDIVEKITRSGPPNPELNLPLGSESQEVTYVDVNTGDELVRAHRYLLPDGRIGASGKPDPKRIWRDGKVYRLQKKLKIRD